MLSSCSTSPLGDAVGGIGGMRITRMESTSTIIWNERERKSPTSTLAALPHGVGGLAPAAQIRFVDHVVVQQGRGVDEFDHRGELQVIAPAVMAARASRCSMGRRRLPPPDDVLGHPIDQHHVRRQPTADQRPPPPCPAGARA